MKNDASDESAHFPPPSSSLHQFHHSSSIRQFVGFIFHSSFTKTTRVENEECKEDNFQQLLLLPSQYQ